MRYDLVLISLVCWGLAVFLPKIAGRDLSPAGVVFSNALGYLVMMPLIWTKLEPRDLQLKGDHLWGISIGVLFVTGNLAYYRLLQTGEVSRYAPLTALYVAIPVLLGALLLREKLSLAQVAGIVLALAAGYLLSIEKPADDAASPTPPAGERVR